jgi:hypothetical protein
MTVGELTEEVKRLRALPQSKAVTGKRAIFVVDRGWIFAGDASKCSDGYIRLNRAVWIFKWSVVGFASVVSDAKKADVRPIDPVEIPAGSVIFRIPVEQTWGL